MDRATFEALQSTTYIQDRNLRNFGILGLNCVLRMLEASGSPEMLQTNRGCEFAASKLLGIGRYFDWHPNLYTQTYGEQISSKNFGNF